MPLDKQALHAFADRYGKPRMGLTTIMQNLYFQRIVQNDIVFNLQLYSVGNKGAVDPTDQIVAVSKSHMICG